MAARPCSSSPLQRIRPGSTGLRLTLRLSPRRPEPYALASTGLLGGVRLRITGPLEWLEEPPPRRRLAAILCCARGGRGELLASLLGSILLALVVGLSFVPGAPGVVGVAVAAVLLAFLEVVTRAIRTRRERSFAACVAEAERLGITPPTLGPVVDIVVKAMEAAKSCGEARCSTLVATPLGPYRLSVWRRVGARVEARPAG